MAGICFYFQVHQPYRLKPYSFFRIGKDHLYENTALNVEIINRVSDLCYLPANRLMLQLIRENEGHFKVTYSITGTCLEQLSRYRPDVIDSFRKLGETGCVEFLAETFYHSLASLYSPTEFERQVKMHTKAITNVLGYKPKVFRNTELLYRDDLAEILVDLGFNLTLAEGGPAFLGGETANQTFRNPEGNLRILPRNFVLSDDIAFRFSDPSWSEYPLYADRFASWVHKIENPNASVHLFMDYETFGEHRKKETGIFEFMRFLPAEILGRKGFHFLTPSDLARIKPARSPVFHAPEWSSWADADKDTSAWTEDRMQMDALKQVYALEDRVLHIGKPDLLDIWGKLQTSDHFYYMSTRYRHDPTHQAFNPYGSPYDAYLNYMNVLSDFKGLLSLR
jgi:alpha-amylase